MLLKLHACLFSLPMLVTNAERSQALSSSGRKNREATLEKQAFAKTKQVDVKAGLQEHDGFGSCKQHGGGCFFDSSCCDDMECLGVIDWKCGNTPGHEHDECNIMYPCDPDLLCFEGFCTDYADILRHGKDEGTCKEGSSPGQLKVMTFNAYLLSCIPGMTLIGFSCEESDSQAERVDRIIEWVKTRDEDVIVFQEFYNLQDELIEGLVAAGFCHYAATPFKGDGDGLATFSKHPIGELDFWDFYDFTGANSERPAGIDVLFADRGIMYAEILKDGRSHHIYNTHTLSNSQREQHLGRMAQYLAVREAAEGKSASDLVLFAGDMNENKYQKDVGDQYYRNMLAELDATDPRMEGDQKYTYDNVANPFTAIYYPIEEGLEQQLLDYVLISRAHLQPLDSSCEILKPSWPEDCDSAGCQLSDHFPVTCVYSYGVTSAVME